VRRRRTVSQSSGSCASADMATVASSRPGSGPVTRKRGFVSVARAGRDSHSRIRVADGPELFGFIPACENKRLGAAGESFRLGLPRLGLCPLPSPRSVAPNSCRGGREEAVRRLRRLARRPPCRRELLLKRLSRRAWRLRRLLAGRPVGRYRCLADRLAAYGRGRRSSRSQEAREAA
jgi:hypothetical protein